jgi:hypothetical protein
LLVVRGNTLTFLRALYILLAEDGAMGQATWPRRSGQFRQACHGRGSSETFAIPFVPHNAQLIRYLVLPTYHDEGYPSAIDPVEVTKVALRLRYLIEECVPCELEEELITKAHSRIITDKVLKAAKEAGGDDYAACVVYCLLVNKRWFLRQAKLEIWDANLHNIRAVAAEIIAKLL